MPTELEELVGFIASPNAQIRKLATENLVPYSTEQPSIFKTEQLTPVNRLKLLIRDHPSTAEHALTILVNLAADRKVLENVATDDKFLSVAFERLIDPSEPNANIIAMLLANLVKWDNLKSVLDRKQEAPTALNSDNRVINQLLDLFVRGADGSYNKLADFNYLAYVFADLSKHPEVRHYFVTKQDYDQVAPLSKIRVFTEHKSDIRRRGVASTIKNVAFGVPFHPALLDEDDINILPYILLPITGNEEYDEDEMKNMLPDLQLLQPDKTRDPDPRIVQTHIETLTLFTTTLEGRNLMRNVMVYPIIRETHLRMQDEGVREACQRLVQVLLADEEEAQTGACGGEANDDDRLVEI